MYESFKNNFLRLSLKKYPIAQLIVERGIVISPSIPPTPLTI